MEGNVSGAFTELSLLSLLLFIFSPLSPKILTNKDIHNKLGYIVWLYVIYYFMPLRILDGAETEIKTMSKILYI